MGFIFTPSIGVNIAFHLYLRLGVTIAMASIKIQISSMVPCVAAILLCSDLSRFFVGSDSHSDNILCLYVRLDAVYSAVQLAKQTLIALTSYMQL